MNPTAPRQGGVGFLSAAGIIKDLFQRRATGELACRSGDAVKRVFFKNGLIVYASSNLAEDRLGDVLVSLGIITRGQFEESVRRIRETGKKQGVVLVQMGALSARDLFKGLNLQVKAIILSLFAWENVAWDFSDGLPPRDEIVNLRIQPAPLILEGVRRKASEGERFLKEWNPGALTFAPRQDPPWIMEDLQLPDEAAKILSLLENKVPWERLPSLLGLEDWEAGAHLYTLALLEMVAVRPRDAAAAPATSRGGQGALGEDGASALPRREKIEELAEKIGRFNLYQVLRLEPGATSAAVKSSYIDLAKQYHPDRFFGVGYDDLGDRVTAIFMRINEAYTVLSNPRRRAEYDRREIRLEAAREREADRDSRIAKEQYLKGIKSLESGDTWTAIESLRWAVQLDPRIALYHSWLGAALTRTKKRLHEAEEHCKTAITLDYSNPLYYVHLGQVYKTGKLLQKARKQFETALKLKPGYAAAQAELENLEN